MIGTTRRGDDLEFGMVRGTRRATTPRSRRTAYDSPMTAQLEQARARGHSPHRRWRECDRGWNSRHKSLHASHASSRIHRSSAEIFPCGSGNAPGDDDRVRRRDGGTARRRSPNRALPSLQQLPHGSGPEAADEAPPPRAAYDENRDPFTARTRGARRRPLPTRASPPSRRGRWRAARSR